MANEFAQKLRWLVIFAGVLGIALIAVTVGQKVGRLPMLPTQPGQTVEIWARYHGISNNTLDVSLATAPTSRALPSDASRAAPLEKRLAIALPPGVKMTADYYMGDIISGTLVNSEPLNLAHLQPGTVLLISVALTGNRRYVARAISWRQSVSQTPLPPMDAKIRPPISPP